MNAPLLKFCDALVSQFARHSKKLKVLLGEDFEEVDCYMEGLFRTLKWCFLKVEAGGTIEPDESEEKIIIASIDETSLLLGQNIWKVLTRKERIELEYLLSECWKAQDKTNCILVPFIRIPATIPPDII